nr:hypothetical protein [Candidatus Njordarchaeota archaeon]
MKLYLSSDIEQSLREAISRDNVNGFARLASSLKWGKPSWSASQLLLQVLDDAEDRLWLWVTKLSCDKNPFTRRYATLILFRLWEKDKNRVGKILESLADDEHWLVREYAHGVWGELLKKHFQQVFPLLRSWSSHSSANLRRCVAIAVRDAGNLRKEEWVEPLIQLLEPLLSDKTTYVRKNLGPYAIGDGLLRCYPDFTLKHLRRWACRKDEGTRWNVAMAFASYGGNRNWQEGLEVLAMLASDKRRYVWRSVASALLYLARRHPEIRNTLKTWMKNPERVKVVDTVLKYLKARKV